ncbi:MAG: response regulator [Pseudomonadota bacterium]
MCKRILVIDDEADVRAYLSAILKKHGYEVLTAENGDEGLVVAKREKPDLISLDLMMPNQSGTDFYRNMVKDPELSETPIIVISGLAGRHLAVKEPVAVFDKPIDPDEFINAVKSALEV